MTELKIIDEQTIELDGRKPQRERKHKNITWAENWTPAKIANLDTPCWDCIGFALSHGYPVINRLGSGTRVHRYIYQILFGFLTKDIDVRHKCDNRLCINPEHLVSGTRLENMQDAVQRKRVECGEKRYNAKLTDTDVLEILAGKENNRQTAQKYNISREVIRDIRLGKVWKHIPRASLPTNRT